MKNYPPTPNLDLIESYLQKWDTLENYILQENSLNLLFHKLCPENIKTEHILLKVSSLNDFYSTNIYDTFTVAKHILNCEIDDSLSKGKLDIVNKIARVKIKKRTINFYSFASKYCSHHNPAVYPIYDSYVEKMLMYFKRVEKFYTFLKDDLKDYPKFVEIIRNFQVYFHLGKFTLRQIDIYLWLAGKQYFPHKY